MRYCLLLLEIIFCAYERLGDMDITFKGNLCNYRPFSNKHRKTSENQKLSEERMDLKISYPLRGLHNLTYDNVNSAMVNGYDTFATLRILPEWLNLKRSII